MGADSSEQDGRGHRHTLLSDLHLPDAKVALALRLRSAGMSHEEIARALRVTRGAVWLALRRLEEG